MREVLVVLMTTLVAAGLIAFAATRVEQVVRWSEVALTLFATVIILFVMLFVCAEVVMRYVFNAPIPGHLEGSELLLPVIVFFAISYTQSKDGHVGMTLVVEALPARAGRNAERGTLVLSMVTCAVLAYFSAKHAYRAWDYDDVTMTPPYFSTWPSAAAVPVGYFLLAVRMYLQLLQTFMPHRFPPPERDDDSDLHTVE